MPLVDGVVEALRKLIVLEETARQSYTGWATDVYTLASARYPPMGEHHLDLITRSPQRFDWTVKGPHLYMPLVTKGKPSLPVSGLCLDLRDEQRPELRFHVAFFAANDLVPDRTQLHGIGFRFETPEGGGVGRHAFYHVQPFTHFAKNDTATLVPNCPEWIPVQQPTFLLHTTDPLGLVAMLLLSVYGPKRVSTDWPELIGRIPQPGTVGPAAVAVEAAAAESKRAKKRGWKRHDKRGRRGGR